MWMEAVRLTPFYWTRLMRAKRPNSRAKTIALLLLITTSCLLNWPHRRRSAKRASSLSNYWNEDKIDDQGSDLGHGDLSILGWNTAFCLTVDRLDLRLGGQLPSRTRHSCFGSTIQSIMSEDWASIVVYWQFLRLLQRFLRCSSPREMQIELGEYQREEVDIRQ